MDKLDGSHHAAKLSEKEIKLLRYWINTGATYPGTYAALGTGSIGLNEGHLITDTSDLDLPEVQEMKAVLEKKCASCHHGDTRLATHPSYVHIQAWVIGDKTWKTNFMRDIVYNLSYPEKSLILLAPLSADAGGYGKCKMDESSKHEAYLRARMIRSTRQSFKAFRRQALYLINEKDSTWRDLSHVRNMFVR